MKLFKENFWEQVIIQITSKVILSIVTLLASIFLVVIIAIKDPFSELVYNYVPKSVLLITPFIFFILLILALFYILHLRKKLKLNLKKALGVYWDVELNPYCPSCKDMLANYAYYPAGKGKKPGMMCISCNKFIHFSNEEKIFFTLEEAKQFVTTKQQTNK